MQPDIQISEAAIGIRASTEVYALTNVANCSMGPFLVLWHFIHRLITISSFNASSAIGTGVIGVTVVKTLSSSSPYFQKL